MIYAKKNGGEGDIRWRKGDSDAALLRNSPECPLCAKGIQYKASSWKNPQTQTSLYKVPTLFAV